MLKTSILTLLASLALMLTASAQGSEKALDDVLAPVAKAADAFIFYSIPLTRDEAGEVALSVPVVLVLLALTAIILNIYFKFINFRSFGLGLRTVRGKYSSPEDPGEITHFQALSAAVSATVGLGNIAGVAVAIGIGGPGAVFWMVMMGLLGMTTKFAECTLGVKFRKFDENGRVQGGAMQYLSTGLAERGFGGVGRVLAIIFAVACIGGALGAGNMFQINQATQQFSQTFNVFEDRQWVLGLFAAVLIGIVILGGIKSIARVTSFLVPFMTVTYILACIVVLGGNFADIPAAFGIIFESAFTSEAGMGGVIGGLIQGIKRGVFSNEAGLGSAAMAHSAVKTRKPASEGVVALLEPFIDTVVICLMTALVIVVTGVWKVDASLTTTSNLTTEPAAGAIIAELEADTMLTTGTVVTVDDVEYKEVTVKDSELNGYLPSSTLQDADGIWLTSQSFGSVISWFPIVLTIAVVLFAFSTMITWSYYGDQAVGYLFGGSTAASMVYKVIFCLCTVVGAGASLSNVILLSDAMYFAMVGPNLIGIYFLLPVIKRELAEFQRFAKRVDEGATLDEAEEG